MNIIQAYGHLAVGHLGQPLLVLLLLGACSREVYK